MKTKHLVFLVVLLLLAMVPAMVMAKNEAKPSKTVKVRIDIRQPIGPQLDAQLGVSSRGPRSATMVDVQRPTRGPGSQAIKPNAVYGLWNEGFEGNGGLPWFYDEAGFSNVGWDFTQLDRKRGQWSLYSAAWANDEYTNPYYDNDMLSWAYTDSLDLQGARRVQIRFQHKTDTELDFDYFYWCGSADGFSYLCEGFTGSTNDKWKLVQLDSRNNDVAAEMLDTPFASFAFIFESDFIFVDRGTFVDAMRIRAWGP